MDSSRLQHVSVTHVTVRLHCSTTYVDAACCYRLSSMVCLSVCHSRKKWLNQSRCCLGWGLRWPKEPCIRWRSRSPCEGRGEGRPIVKYRDVRPWAVQKWLNHWDAVMDLDLGAYIGWGCTLAPPGKYHWTVHVWWRCGLLSNYFDQWLHFAWVVDNKRKYISIGRAHLCVCVCPSLHACITARTQM